MDYLYFWGRYILRAFDFSRGVIDLIAFLIVLGGSYGVFKMLPKKVTAKLDALGVNNEPKRVGFLFLVSLILYTVALGPYELYQERAPREDKPFNLTVTSANEDKELQKDFQEATNTIVALETQLERATNELTRIRGALNETTFTHLASSLQTGFVSSFKLFFMNWPTVTNIAIIVDTTEGRRRQWAEQVGRVISESNIPIQAIGGMNFDNGRYDLVMFYKKDLERAIPELARVFTNLAVSPIMIAPTDDTNDPYQISIRVNERTVL
jgi:hypothetical protein